MLKQGDYLLFLAALLSFLLSVALWFGFLGEPDREAGIFVGIWVPSILSIGNILRSGRGA